MKTKHTVYLPQSTLDVLDGLWLELRAAFKSRQVTKSTIIQLAIEAATKEYQEHGKDSRLYQAFSEELGILVKEDGKAYKFWDGK